MSVILRSKSSNVIPIARPLNPACFDPLVKEQESVSIPHKPFEPILFPAAKEKEDIFLERIEFELLLHDRGESVDPPAEVGATAGDIDFFKQISFKIP